MKKMIFLYLTIAYLLFSSSISAQVTIGSDQKPASGALLDLKQETDGSSKKGLGLPRVKLADIDKLKMGTNEILDTDNDGDQYKKHTGLVVYNISGVPIPKCAPIPDGFYVWDGGKWNGLGVTKEDPATLTISGSDINFPSGLAPMAETFTVGWTPSDKPMAYTNVAHATWGGISFNGSNTPPASGNLTTNPTTFSLLPNAMLASDITVNPFHTKQNTLTFKVANECGSDITEVRVVNQTNKALIVSTPFKEYTTTTFNETNTLTTNADWKLASIEPADGTTTISNVRIGSSATNLPTNTTQTGYEQNNNEGRATTLTYNITLADNRARYSTLTFTDASATKRFRDVSITVFQCSNVVGVNSGVSPSIEQWALTTGFTQEEINNVKTTGLDSPILANGIQLHRDQSNNLFLSSNFGTNPQDSDERWMIHNLAAKQYSPNTSHGATPARALYGPNANVGKPYNTAYWVYPKSQGAVTVGEAASTKFINDPRVGLLYTWDAATASKGGNSGQANINDGVGLPHANVQGVCPDSWHLPSDYEWTVLENKIIQYTATFSNTANINASNPNVLPQGGREDAHGTLHGKAMKEICNHYTLTHQGTSNGINSTARPGFEVLFAGYAFNGMALSDDSTAGFWSASGNDTTSAWHRNFAWLNSSVYRSMSSRYVLYSVRCKK